MVNQRGSTEEMDMAITINHDGDTWRVVGIGTRRDGKVYCHLASTTRSRKQRNGNNPIQIADWIDEAVIEAGRAQCSTGPDVPPDEARGLVAGSRDLASEVW